MDKIRGRYYVADCEHRGDMEREIEYLTALGCEVIDNYWDGRDCGDAYIDFYCGKEVVAKKYRNISFRFDCDIREFVDLRKDAIKRLKSKYNVVDSDEYQTKKDELILNVGLGFQRNMPIELVFSVEKYGLYKNPLEHIHNFTCHIGDIVSVKYIKIDGDTYSVLLTCSFDDTERVVGRIRESFWKGDGLISVKPIHNVYTLLGEPKDFDSFVVLQSVVNNLAYDIYPFRFVNDEGKEIAVSVEDFITDNKLIDLNYNGYHLDTTDPLVVEEC